MCLSARVSKPAQRRGSWTHCNRSPSSTSGGLSEPVVPARHLPHTFTDRPASPRQQVPKAHFVVPFAGPRARIFGRPRQEFGRAAHFISPVHSLGSLEAV